MRTVSPGTLLYECGQVSSWVVLGCAFRRPAGSACAVLRRQAS